MGKGKKKVTIQLKEKSLPSWTSNCSVTARNLRKSDLGGVIFGCKHSTIKECFFKQIFGLPAPHYAYVKNIDSGLPLFLFNYSDRRLHGIFEAASTGKMNINRYGWTSDGSDTPYAAQVRIKMRVQCQPLQEDQFRPIIEDNYYESKHFWFELDRGQTEKLISLFSSSPVTSWNNLSNNSEKWSTLFKVSSAPNSWQEGDSAKASKRQMLVALDKNEAAENDHHGVTDTKPSCGRSYSSVVRNMSTHGVHSDQSNTGWGSLDDASGLGSESKLLEATISKDEVENYEVAYGQVNHVQTYSSVVQSDQSNMGWNNWDDNPDLGSERQLLGAAISRGAVENCVVAHKHLNHEQNYSSLGHSDQSNMVWGCSWDDAPGLVRESQLMGDTIRVSEENYSKVLHEQGNDEHTYASFVESMNSSLPQKSFISLFKTESTSIASGEVEKFKIPESEVNFTDIDQCNMEWESSQVPTCLDGENQLLETPAVEEALGNYCEGQGFKTEKAVMNSPCLAPNVSGHNHPSEAAAFRDCGSGINVCEDELGINQKECADYKTSGESTVASETTSEDKPGECCEVQVADICFSEAVLDSEMKPTDLQNIFVKLVEEVKELKSSQLEQVQKISFLEQELADSRLEIQKMKNCFKIIESTSELDEAILVVGGFDGSSWLSALDTYYPSSDSVNSLNPMSSVHTYAAAAKLNDELYIFGGVCGNVWYNSVESYNLVTNQWNSRPSLNRGKGSLAGITLDDKIFAIGGGDGTQSLSEVEMFDLDVGRWIPTTSMKHKRFAPAAAEMNGVLYVAGGYDGNDYLKSFERFDPREYSWKRLASMTSRRGCHSLAVLNEKLYALGGYNGTTMVPTVEVFDPRLGSWTMGEPMNHSRGYSGAVVIRDTIYVIGGLSKNDEILDAVETYKDGHGWQVTNLKALGKRGFFSTIAR